MAIAGFQPEYDGTICRAASSACGSGSLYQGLPGKMEYAASKCGAEAVIPSTTSRRAPIPYDTLAYKDRNRVERMWCRLKDFRRVATRYDKLARNYLSSVLLAAICAYWLN